MERHAEVQHPQTFRTGKYVLAIETLLPTFRSTKLPGTWCTVPELVDRFPEQVIQQVVGRDGQLPEFRYHYSGKDPRYNGAMPEATVPADFLLRIKRGRAFGRDCVIYGPDGTGLQEFDYQQRTLTALQQELPGGRFNPRYWKHTLRTKRLTKRLPAVRYWPGKVAALNAPSSHNYYHWMLEVLPRLHTLQKCGIVPDWYLVDAFSPFQLQTLRAFDVPLDRVLQPYSGMHVEAEELLVPSRHFPNSCREIGAELIRRIGPKDAAASSRRIFINRRGSRQPSNVDQFRQVLHQFGFEEHYLEDYSMPRQIELFQHAKVVVAMHGAGLTNTVFCSPGVFVVELMPEGKYRPCYPMLSRLCDLRHYLVSAKRTGFTQDVLVPLETVRSLLTDLLSERPESMRTPTAA
ncbi:MAG: glycosyltransferase family 61 protein [Planctomycetota bacterium]|nr:glycosyltransferase family 61 protein [Planctomycetota bacterium]